MSDGPVLFDTSILILMLQPDARPPKDPATGEPLAYARQRVEYLLKRLSKARTKILIPAPALAELLAYAGAATDQYVQTFQRNSTFVIAPFGTRAAIECGLAMRSRGIKGQGKGNPRTKIKFDRQIVAVASVERASTVYSDDEQVRKFAEEAGMSACSTLDLELDPAAKQQRLPLTPDEDD